MKCEKLDVWKRTCRLSVDLYSHFNDSREFGFKDQITRSSLSVGSNIAEGLEKDSLAENLRYLEIAKGSVAELITQLYIGMEAGFIGKEQGFVWIKESNEVLKMIKGYKNYLQKRGQNEK
ncbi:four helix bundle protein [Sulfurovum sp.]|jgi:four helix bundle protein|uniref:four helix bundle protein n=1 Tax=Sulfurovum sp. TaxID=1969726 RepID=UPI0025EA17A2|nr:four helix bundle protein [Sulfurovum sp.]